MAGGMQAEDYLGTRGTFDARVLGAKRHSAEKPQVVEMWVGSFDLGNLGAKESFDPCHSQG